MYSQRLKQIRKHFKYTIDEMAEKISIKPRALASYERNERTPSIELATQLCDNLNINANWFVSGRGEMFNLQQYDEVKNDFENKVVEILKKKGLL